MSGQRVTGFTAGWAVPITFRETKAHYYRRRDLGFAKPICGRAPAMKAGGLLHEGNWDRCQHCEAVILRSGLAKVYR